jgi:hypothetical protein
MITVKTIKYYLMENQGHSYFRVAEGSEGDLQGYDHGVGEWEWSNNLWKMEKYPASNFFSNKINLSSIKSRLL